MKPLFSIGVPAYNRRELLKETLNSILNQTFSDYEVVVSNDCTEEKLSLSELGIDDPRFRLINQEKNLGPLENHQFTMNLSQGKYFTWLSDDDLMATTYLESMHAALELYPASPCIFSTFDSGKIYSRKEEAEKKIGNIKQLSGRQFLRDYLSGEIKTIGNYGVFTKEYITEEGGFAQFGPSLRTVYNEALLVIKAGLLEKVTYIDAPLVFFRVHEDSLSETAANVDDFIFAHHHLLSKCDKIFMDNELSEDFQRNMYHLLMWFAGNIYAVSSRGRSFLPDGAFSHLMVLERRARATGWFYPKFIIRNLWFAAKYVLNRMLQKSKKK